MLTLLSTLISFLMGGLPKFLEFFQDRSDKKHELELAQLQIQRELADATIKKDREDIVDAVGDTMVCLINYCALQDINLVDCMQVAYDTIKNRTGTLLPNGVFVKD